MKKMLFVYGLLIFAFLIYVFQYMSEDNKQGDPASIGLRGETSERYVMVTFQSGLEYWKSVLKGFEDAADAMNVSIEYRGATGYDIHEQITVLEQVIAKKPAGIALSAMNSHALTAVINRAVDEGIPVVLFDSGAPNSKAYSLLATNNYNAGVTAANQMSELVGGEGEVAVITLPGQQNHIERTQGFTETIKKSYPNIKVVDTVDGKGRIEVSRNQTEELLTKHPDLTGIFITEATGGVGVGEVVKARMDAGQSPVQIISFDTNKGTLDMIQDGIISTSIAQGTWNMGYWSLQYLFHLHHELTIPAPSTTDVVSPLPVQVDTGINVVNKQNVEQYYAK